jgi:hypothetical protein
MRARGRQDRDFAKHARTRDGGLHLGEFAISRGKKASPTTPPQNRGNGAQRGQQEAAKRQQQKKSGTNLTPTG